LCAGLTCALDGRTHGAVTNFLFYNGYIVSAKKYAIIYKLK